MPKITVMPGGAVLSAEAGENLLQALRRQGVFVDAPCGGQGSCGKCTVWIEDREVSACRTTVKGDMTVTIPRKAQENILFCGKAGEMSMDSYRDGYRLAFDIGTTSVACYLLDEAAGEVLARQGSSNPQSAYGADVISRIRAALAGEGERLTGAIRKAITELTLAVCRQAQISPESIGVVSVVGNPAMQQLFLGISPENLVRPPFAPVLTEGKIVPCGEYLPVCPNGILLIVPDISGYVGADTVACVLSAGMYQAEELTLLVDIGTNGELVLGDRNRMIACATAAGPALEGANLRFGMRGEMGAIDHVRREDGTLCCHVIGGGAAKGICGSGLVDAVAVVLDGGLLNSRGKILTGDRVPLTEDIYLTQEDIRQVQLAKGAVSAGIRLMAQALGVQLTDIRRVLLAGAFGNALDPDNACRIGLLPEELHGRITSVGNAAGSGARMLACDRGMLQLAQKLAEKIEFLELADVPGFPRAFASAMRFREGKA